MEKNTDNTSEQLTEFTSTAGLQALADQKFKSKLDTNVFRKFIRTPTRLCFLLFLAAWGLVGVLVAGWLPDSFWGGAWWLAFFCLVSIPLNALKLVVRSYAIRHRMWLWGRTKFDSWKEYRQWLTRIDGMELDRLVGLNTDDWYPTENGFEILVGKS